MVDSLAETITAIAALVAATGGIIAAWLSYRARERAAKAADAITVVGDQIFELGKRVDGRLTELLKAQSLLSRAQGVVEGTQAERDRANEASN